MQKITKIKVTKIIEFEHDSTWTLNRLKFLAKTIRTNDINSIWNTHSLNYIIKSSSEEVLSNNQPEGDI